MSTRSYICIENEDKTLTGIYCHWDGYIEYNGTLLQGFYRDRQSVEELIKLGNISSLCPTVYQTKYEAYGGEDNKAHAVELQDLLQNIMIEYIYVYGLDGKWRAYYFGNENGDLLEKLVVECWTKEE